MKRLYRSAKERIIGGVCGGIAEYLGVDPAVIRILWIISIFLFGVAIPFYILAWIITPRNPSQKW
jgi:phage shock protein C